MGEVKLSKAIEGNWFGHNFDGKVLACQPKLTWIEQSFNATAKRLRKQWNVYIPATVRNLFMLSLLT